VLGSHDPAFSIPRMLVLSAEDLHSRPDLSSLADQRPPEDTVGANADPALNPCLRVRKERSKLDAALDRAFVKGQPVIGGPQIISRQAGRESATLRPEPVGRCEAPEA